MISALFVATNGCYFNLTHVDPWDVIRDARTYQGPHKVVVHPPCERWGRYWFGGPSVRVRRELGSDEGCFESALGSVRAYGGVLEHPEGSHAFAAFGLPKPPKSGGWIPAPGGFVCCVEQGHYGHKARKATWLYTTHKNPPELLWGKAEGKVRLEEGFHSSEERERARSAGVLPVPRLSAYERLATPIAFRDILLEIAKGA